MIEKNISGLIPEQFTASGLDQTSLDEIIKTYGDEIEDIYPLMPGQAWMLEKTKHITDEFFLQTVMKITAPFDLETFTAHVNEVCKKRPSMRTAFAWRGLETPFQVVLKNRKPEIIFEDHSDRTLDELSAFIDDFCIKDRKRGFEPDSDPLFRISILKAKEKDTYAMIMSRPHLIEDGSSQMLMQKEIFIDFLLKEKIKTPDLSNVSYKAYADWFESIDKKSELDYWKNILDEASMTQLPGRKISEHEQDSNIKTITCTLPKELNDIVLALPARYNATLSSILHAAWAVILGRITGQDDVVFGTVTAGRDRAVTGIERMTGCFMNAFPVRVKINDTERFGDLARNMQSQILTSQEKAHFSPEELRVFMKDKGQPFDHLLNFHNYPGIPVSSRASSLIPGAELLDFNTYDNLSTGFCLYFSVQDGVLSSRFTYDENSFSEKQIRKFSDIWFHMLKQVALDMEQELAVSDFRVGDTVTDIILNNHVYDELALVSARKNMTYEELVKDIKHIAYYLIQNGIKKGDRVMICMHRRVEFFSVIQGILMAGGVYVTCEPDWPEERIGHIGAESNTVFRVTDEKAEEILNSDVQECELPLLSGEDEACICYTSGSTGEPKGTILRHRVLMALTSIDAEASRYKAIRNALVLTPSFTVLTTMACMVFLSNKRYMIVTSEEELVSPEKIAKLMHDYSTDCIVATPSVILHCLEDKEFAEAFQNIKIVNMGGEMLTPETAGKMKAATHGMVVAGYGSSEMYICALYGFTPGGDIRLGHPMPGVKLYVADESGEPVKPGQKGELLIGGVPGQSGLYLNSPELNREKYIVHPDLGRLFRTGDAALLGVDGEITLLGRVDNMIKLHGLRIEPGEIEKKIKMYPGIRRAVVCLRDDKICCYYSADDPIDEGRLRRALLDALPYYMVPVWFMYMDELPLNEVGKLDQKNLPGPDISYNEYVEPGSERERMICRIFEKALDVKEPVGASDNFFMLGGDSLSGMMVLSCLEEEGYHIRIKDLFAAPEPHLLASLLEKTESVGLEADLLSELDEESRKAISEKVPLDNVESVYPASRVMEDYLRYNNSTYPQVYCFEIPASISAEMLEHNARCAAENHAALRILLLPGSEGQFMQVVLKEPRVSFFSTDLSGLSEGDDISDGQKKYLASLLKMEYSPLTELGGKTLFRVGRIQISDNKAILYIGSSHLSLEGSSVYRVLYELTGKEKIIQDADVYRRHYAKLYNADRSEALAYWNALIPERINEHKEDPSGIYDKLMARTEMQNSPAGIRRYFFASSGEKLYEKAIQFCSRNHITVSALVVLSLGRTLMDQLGLNDVCFFAAGSGRDALEMNIPGMFVLFFPVRVTRNDTVMSLQEQILSSSEHAWVWEDGRAGAGHAVSPNQESGIRADGRAGAGHAVSPNQESGIRADDRAGGLISDSVLPIYLSMQNYYKGTENAYKRLEHKEILDAKQAQEMLNAYPISSGDALGIIAETDSNISFTGLFDEGCYDPEFVKGLQAELIHQIRKIIEE